MNLTRYFLNVTSSLGALLSSPFHARSRLALSHVRSALRAPAEPFYTELRWEDLFGDDAEVTLGRISEYPGNTSLIEIAALCRFIEVYDLRRVFEIGTFDGRTTYNLARQAGPEGRVVTLNLPEEDYSKEWIHEKRQAKSGYRFHGTDAASRITEVFCDSRKLDAAPYEGKFDFVFIDGDHEAEAVTSDAELSLKFLSPTGRGLLVWHDADFGTVQTGIWKFLENHGWPKRAFALPCTRMAILFLLDRKPVDWKSFADSARG